MPRELGVKQQEIITAFLSLKDGWYTCSELGINGQQMSDSGAGLLHDNITERRYIDKSTRPTKTSATYEWRLIDRSAWV